LCPYLVADGFGWRSAAASRDHRCGAVSPPVPLTLEKQRRLCLVNRHLGCPTYLAAAELSGRAAELAADESMLVHAPRASDKRQPGGEAITRWSIVRTVPVLLDRRGVPGILTGAARAATSRQATLIGVLATAFIVIAFSRLGGGGAPAPAATARPTAVVAAASSTVPPHTSSAPAAAAPSPPATTSPATPTPAATLPPTQVARSYVVKRGDTLWAIARQFGTSVGAIQQLNRMGSSTRLHAGDVLKIPGS
jgi:LysM repeat protein